MTTYRTPGVYVEEKDGFPPSVAEIQSAIPFFIGYTGKTQYNGKDIKNEAVKIGSMMEFFNHYGGPPPVSIDSISLGLTADGKVDEQNLSVTNAELSLSCYLYHSMLLYFENGGSDCYVVSIGTFDEIANASKDNFAVALKLLEKEHEPTIIVMPDALLLSESDFYGVYQDAMEYCHKLVRLFTVMDLRLVDDKTKKLKSKATKEDYDKAVDDPKVGFRALIGMKNLKYGAVYTPYLKVHLSQYFKMVDVERAVGAHKPAFKIEVPSGGDPKSLPEDTYMNTKKIQSLVPQFGQLATQLAAFPVTMPPSPAMAGVYVANDRDKGVFHAPANVGLSASVTELGEKITDKIQENLNIDVQAGKSINAIRVFPGYGNLVWGARTLAGNSNDWHYISVRRFMSIVEKSIQLSLEWAVFENNDIHLWLKIQGMIENYLTDKWKEGALQGAKAADAFIVNVGLGSTMTAEDILNGYLRVSVKMAVVRPAEFIVLTFQQQMAKSS